MGPADVLRQLRLQRGYTQEGLAPLAGVTVSAIAQYEAGRIHPRRTTAARIDSALNAGGAILAAYGYALEDGNEFATKADLADLRAELIQLREEVLRVVEGIAAHIAEGR